MARAASLVLSAVVALAGCTSSGPPTPAPAPAPRFAARLLPPSAEYPLAADPAALAQIDAAHDRLLRGAQHTARRAAESRLEQDPGFHPATVLLAEVEIAEGRAEAAIERLRGVVSELPRYAAAQLVLAAAADETGDVPVSFAAYAAIADLVPDAAAEARARRPRALEIAGHRLDEALDRGRHDQAEAQLVFLERWAPDEAATWEAARSVARAMGNGQRELAAVRRLAAMPGAGRELRVALATLEVEAGDAGAGVRMFQDLARQFPDDAALAERLSWATYRFRLQLLPAAARGVAERAQLSRADLAVLLYWLVPDVRYGRGGAVRIASDVLDHPQREEVVRVLNLGLLDLDQTLHRFYPDRSATQGETLAAVLRLLANRGRVACVGGLGARAVSRDASCGLAAACGLIAEPAGCLPGAPVSGAEATAWIQRSLELAGER